MHTSTRHQTHADALSEAQARIEQLQRKLAARDKVIEVLKQRVKDRDESVVSPLDVLEQNISLGRVVALKTRELSEERHELEQALGELGKAQAMLLQAQKMESIGQLAAGIAHEINTPTQYVRDNVAFVQKAKALVDPVVDAAVALAEAVRSGDAGVDAELAAFDAAIKRARFDYIRRQVPEAMEQALEGLARISKIVGAMKDFSHPSAGDKEPVDIALLVNTTITVTRNEWKYLADMETEIEPNLPAVSCLRDEVGQVLLNLIVNAAHAIADTLKAGEKEKGHLKVSAHRHGQNWIELRVTDDGTGIPVQARSKVFDPFFTTKGVGKGTGQGLAIAYATVVDKHRGEIFFETQIGHGTTFVVRLPLKDPSGDRDASDVCR